MTKHTTLKQTIKTNLLAIGTCALLCTSSIQAQVGKSDWEIKPQTSNKKLTTPIAKKSIITQISLPDFYSKMINGKQTIAVPNPNKEFENFIITPSSVVADEVAHLYSIKTFTGHKADDPSVLIACDIDELGFHAAIYTPHNTYFIEPKDDNGNHIIYFKHDSNGEPIKCNSKEHDHTHKKAYKTKTSAGITSKKNYRIAIASAGEFSQQFGGAPYNTTNVLNAIASGVNMIRPIYLRDLGVSFTLVTDESLIFPNPDTDPFNDTNNDNFLNIVHNTINAAIGINNYDVGHLVMWAETGGVASLGSVCDNNFKGKGFSGTSFSEVTLWVDYASHEIGHQFGSEHNFTSEECGTSVSGFRYEPGEGSSIMSYAGVCGQSASYTQASDPFFHYTSIEQMMAVINSSSSCATTDASGNTADPIANAQADITIPKQTPFILVGSATDANDVTNQLTYGWQQHDGDGFATSNSPSCNSIKAALFRYRPPSTNNFRSFPAWSDVWEGNNNTMDWEKLPCTSRTMNFSMTVRDNNPIYGRVANDKVKVTVANTGPFEITSPNESGSTEGGATESITWSVNGTDAHCPKVDIFITTDGGESYTLLADGTDNDGTHEFTVPNVESTKTRFLIQCDIDGEFKSASTFYDVSNADMSITKNLGVGEFNDVSLSIFPNPAEDFITIQVGNIEQFDVQLVSMSGVIFKQDSFNSKGTINTSNLSPGLYLLIVDQKSTSNKTVKKIIIK